MASSTAVKQARRPLLWLVAIVVILAGLIGLGYAQKEATLTPKLALDLQGGTQILLAPQNEGGKSVSPEQVQQAVSIIRQRVDAAGVSEAEITTQGGSNILVSIPGKADEATLQRIEAAARLDLRAVLAMGSGIPSSLLKDKDAKDKDKDAAAPDDATIGDPSQDPAAAADPAAAPAPGANPDGENPDGAQSIAEPGADSLYPNPLPKEPGSPEWLTPELQKQFNEFDCSPEKLAKLPKPDAKKPTIACDITGTSKFILGGVELTGERIADAVAALETTQHGATTGRWAINIEFDGNGKKTFAKISQRLVGQQEPLNQFAFLIDDRVLVAPSMNTQILDGRAQITGGFTEDGAKALADQLKYGALPLSFMVQSQEDISATLGTSQLYAGLIAGLIGLIIVVIYSVFQYRGLALLTISSLLVAAIITYLLLTLLSWRQGYRLSLAGVTGIIVAIGFTADSFIVYFERVRDSLRDGFALPDAVQQGWKKAFRTILASDGINFLAAAVLFLLAVGSVRGFAFTLGLTTLVDLIVVALFTHPMLVLMARTRFWGAGHKASGLDPRQLGAVYRGRAQFATPIARGEQQARRMQRSQKEAKKRQTIAERKAAAAQSEES